MNFRLGNQTSFAARHVLEPFEFALKNGFTAFEFFPDRGFSGVGGWDERELNSATRSEIKRRAVERNILLTVHAPLEFRPLLDPQDDRLYSTVSFAADIGAKLLVLHLELSQGAERFVDSILPARMLTGEAGLKLAIENTVFTGPEEFNRVFELIHSNRASRDTVGMCFDMGHANLCSATHNDYCGFLDKLSPDVPIIHLHLHENFEHRDSHLPLFTGPAKDKPDGVAGMLERLEKRKFAGAGIFEQWPQPASLLCNARDRLEKLRLKPA